MADVNYNQLKENVAALNHACGLTIKTVGSKKDDLIKAFTDAMENGLSGIPESVTQYYESTFKNPVADETTKFGNTQDVLTKHAENIGVQLQVGLSIVEIEELVLETLSGLTEEEWDKLPVETQQWDIDMHDLAEEARKQTAKDSGTKEKKEKGAKKSAEGKEKGEKADQGPRPDFKFSEKTNAAHIMSIFNELFKASKGEGIKPTDLVSACEKANVKTSNVKGRVAAVIKYASLPEGGSQVTKVKGLIYPTGKEPKE